MERRSRARTVKRRSFRSRRAGPWRDVPWREAPRAGRVRRALPEGAPPQARAAFGTLAPCGLVGGEIAPRYWSPGRKGGSPWDQSHPEIPMELTPRRSQTGCAGGVLHPRRDHPRGRRLRAGAAPGQARVRAGPPAVLQPRGGHDRRRRQRRPRLVGRAVRHRGGRRHGRREERRRHDPHDRGCAPTSVRLGGRLRAFSDREGPAKEALTAIGGRSRGRTWPARSPKPQSSATTRAGERDSLEHSRRFRTSPAPDFGPPISPS